MISPYELTWVPLLITGTAADPTITLRPGADGFMYVVYDLYVYHDDNGAARDCHIQITDGSTSIRLIELAALANDTKKWLRAETGNSRPLILTYRTYLQFYVAAIAAGKKGYIGAVIGKIRGMPSDAGV